MDWTLCVALLTLLIFLILAIRTLLDLVAFFFRRPF